MKEIAEDVGNVNTEKKKKKIKNPLAILTHTSTQYEYNLLVSVDFHY